MIVTNSASDYFNYESLTGIQIKQP